MRVAAVVVNVGAGLVVVLVVAVGSCSDGGSDG